MENPIITTLVNDEAQTNNSGTYKKSLPRAGALHALLVTVKATNGATDGSGVNVINNVVDRIEIRGDSGKILYSMYPDEIEKWYETEFGRGLQMVEDQQGGAVQECVFPIYFGRKIYDPEMYLPLSRFDDVKLEIEYSPTIASSAGFASGSVTVNIQTVITPPDGQLPYMGTLIRRTMKDHTTVASGVETFDLPGSSLLRQIGIYCYEAGIADGVDVTGVELKNVSKGKSLWKGDWSDLINLNREYYGVNLEHYAVLAVANDETWNSRIGTIDVCLIQPVETADVTNDEWDMAHIDAIAGDTLTIDLKNADITSGFETVTAQTTQRVCRVMVRGKSPSYFGFIPFNFDDRPEGYFQTPREEQLTLELTQGAAGGQIYVTTEELERLQ